MGLGRNGVATAHRLGSVICVGDYARSGHGMSPGFISPSKYSEDYSLQTIYIHFTGDHFNVVLSQELIHVSSFF